MARDRCAQRLALRRHGTHATRVDGQNGRPARHTTHPPPSRPVRAGSSHAAHETSSTARSYPQINRWRMGVSLGRLPTRKKAGYWVRLRGCSWRRTRRHTPVVFAARSPRSPPMAGPAIPGPRPTKPGRPPRGRVGRRGACRSAPWQPARRPGLLNARPPRVGHLLAGLSGVWRDPHSRSPVDPCRRARMALLPLQRTRRPTRQHLRLQGRAALRPRVLSVDSTRAEGPRHRATGTTAARWRARRRRQPATLTAANRVAARRRLGEILSAATAPPPRQRRLTRPTRSSDERRIEAKKRRGSVKRQRGRRDQLEE